jgi:hypothetical protein
LLFLLPLLNLIIFCANQVPDLRTVYIAPLCDLLQQQGAGEHKEITAGHHFAATLTDCRCWRGSCKLYARISRLAAQLAATSALQYFALISPIFMICGMHFGCVCAAG